MAFEQLKIYIHLDPDEHISPPGGHTRTRRRHAPALKAWKPSDKPAWLDEKTYTEKTQPRLAEFPVSAISSALGVSRPYASDIRAGKRRPHPRHWEVLAQLAGISGEGFAWPPTGRHPVRRLSLSGKPVIRQSARHGATGGGLRRMPRASTVRTPDPFNPLW